MNNPILSPVPTIQPVQVDMVRLNTARSSPANNYYTNAELRGIARRAGLGTSGTKAQLVARIKGALTIPTLPPTAQFTTSPPLTTQVQFVPTSPYPPPPLTTQVQFVPTSPYPPPTTHVPETP